MKIFKVLLIALPLILVVFLIVAALQPADYKVARSTNIAAPAPAVFAHVNDLHKFQGWSPWADVDPNCKYTFEGPPTGAGSAFSWNGNAAVGAGKMTIEESRANELVRARLDFFKPFAGVGLAEYGFKADGARTTVTWTMTGKKNFITKAIGLFVSMDKMLGPQFEKGLEKLKSIAESGKAAAERPARGAVESLLTQLEGTPASTAGFELWVPQDLTLRGERVAPDAAMAILGDKIIGMGFQPDGFSEAQGGRTYRYKPL